MMQARKQDVRWLTLMLPLLLGACANGRGESPALAAAYGGDMQQLLVTPESADELSIKGFGTVQVGRTYLAASGRKCRELNSVDGSALPLRSCQKTSGEWYTTRSISAPGLTRITASAAPVVSSIETVERTLKDGESLWTFSSRVTGSPLNWKRIAADNDLADVDKVRPGQVLQVELSLLKDAP